MSGDSSSAWSPVLVRQAAKATCEADNGTVKRQTVISCLWRVRQALKLVMCSTARIQAVSWYSSSVPSGSCVFLDSFKKAAGLSCSSELRKYSVPKGDEGCSVRIYFVFLTPVSWWLWKQGTESKGWSQIICSWEPYETSPNKWISVLTNIQPRAAHTSSANAPSCSPAQASSHYLPQCGTSDCCILGLSCNSLGFARVELP